MAKANLAYIGREYLLTDGSKGPAQVKLNLNAPPVTMDLNLKQHTFIVGSSGSGKTYLLGDIAEEAIRTIGNYAVVLVDPMGNLSTLNRPNTDEALINQWNALTKDTIQPAAMTHVTTWVPAGDRHKFKRSAYQEVFSLKASELTHSTLCFTFDLKLLSPQANLYRKAQRRIMEEKGEYTLDQFIAFIQEHGAADMHFKDQTVEALVTKLDALAELGLIQDEGVSIHQIVQEGKVAVLNLSMSDYFTARIIVSFLAEKCLALRKEITEITKEAQAEDTLADKPANYIPPLLLGIDEAHKFLPASPALCECIREGRNCALVTLFVSQSVNLDRDLYQNLTHLFVGAMTFDSEIASVQEMLPVVKKPLDFRKQVKDLRKGHFLYYNTEKKTQQQVRVRPRRTLHLATTELLDERAYFKNGQQPAMVQPEPPVVLARSAAGSTLEPIAFSQHFSKLDRPTFSTIRRHDKDYAIKQVRSITLKGHGMVGQARILFKHAKCLPDLADEFLCQDTDTRTRAEAVACLNSFYDAPIGDDEELTILTLEWVH